ncbi:Na+/H+ dicarboxylate symporter [Thermanaerovibrio velox DSM 12556]|uniref:Na+/H+ dicarboxylate symporter n=1 Tax=Thermanaerovibrio velox DSM 12556 TaxID=926567 RepID=H0UMS5_9BACT|nr:dicarboxylate/amino acid:cation symporter [Thermanaerovibrio velox]EHM09220.1 Na+/H+ dicarboxylate symporter [Thermanaerovibrio velox DSM 12556]
MSNSGNPGSGGLLGFYFRSSLVVRILLATVLGAGAGLLVGPEMAAIKPLGDLLIRLLKMIVIPVVFFSLVVGASSVTPSKLGTVGVKVVGYYMLTSAVAVAIGLGVGNLFKPGAGLDLPAEGAVDITAKAPSLVETLLNIVPDNPVAAMVNGTMLQIIFFALLFGIALSVLMSSSDERLKSSGEAMFRICDGGAEAMYKITKWAMEYAPIGVFALMATAFGQQGAKAAGPLGMTIMAMYLAFLIHFVVVYGISLKLVGLGLPWFVRNAKDAMLTAFVTRSSSATLPVSMEAAEEMGAPKGIYSFSLPLGATINMNGTAIYQGICVLFVANCIGQNLTISQQLMVILSATLAAIGTAGVPGSGAIMLLMVLNSAGISLTGGAAAAYGMILGIDAIMDMGRTLLNVTGDIVGTVMVAKAEGELDQSRWKG